MRLTYVKVIGVESSVYSIYSSYKNLLHNFQKHPLYIDQSMNMWEDEKEEKFIHWLRLFIKNLIISIFFAFNNKWIWKYNTK